MLPGEQYGIDKPTMNRTLDEVLKTWNLPAAWGWDFGLMACVGRLCSPLLLLLDFFFSCSPSPSSPSPPLCSLSEIMHTALSFHKRVWDGLGLQLV